MPGISPLTSCPRAPATRSAPRARGSTLAGPERRSPGRALGARGSVWLRMQEVEPALGLPCAAGDQRGALGWSRTWIASFPHVRGSAPGASAVTLALNEPCPRRGVSRPRGRSGRYRSCPPCKPENQPPMEQPRALRELSTPHGRESALGVGLHVREEEVHPARPGISPTRSMGTGRVPSPLPGNQPIEARVRLHSASAPHARGSAVAARQEVGGGRVCPARPGISPLRTRRSSGRASPPRAPGDPPGHPPAERDGRTSSPRAWGSL